MFLAFILSLRLVFQNQIHYCNLEKPHQPLYKNKATKKKKKTARAGSCVCFYFLSFALSFLALRDIIFSKDPSQNGLSSCCLSALFVFSAAAAGPSSSFFSYLLVPSIWSYCHCRFSPALSFEQTMCSPGMSLCSVNQVWKVFDSTNDTAGESF